MQQMLGFSNFDTSKGKDHATSDEWMIKRRSKRKYRQYMNRRGGFNRPLDSVF
jgi:U4/U6.U5 tri-snRNP-associated protein 3